jgi:hypothetical protein
MAKSSSTVRWPSTNFTAAAKTKTTYKFKRADLIVAQGVVGKPLVLLGLVKRLADQAYCFVALDKELKATLILPVKQCDHVLDEASKPTRLLTLDEREHAQAAWDAWLGALKQVPRLTPLAKRPLDSPHGLRDRQPKKPKTNDTAQVEETEKKEGEESGRSEGQHTDAPGLGEPSVPLPALHSYINAEVGRHLTDVRRQISELVQRGEHDREQRIAVERDFSERLGVVRGRVEGLERALCRSLILTPLDEVDTLTHRLDEKGSSEEEAAVPIESDALRQALGRLLSQKKPREKKHTH